MTLAAWPSPPAAVDLIAQVLTSARPGDRRARDEAAALQQVAELCGRLPLALQITAEILKADPGLPVAAMAMELQDPTARLAALSREDGGARTRAVRAAFEASYRRLAAEQARLFRLLALNPGPDTATEAAAALVGAPAGQVRPLLAALAGASLVAEQPVGGDRWRMHDLIRLYAAELGRDSAREDQSGAALDRLLEHYRDTTAAADDHLRAVPSQPVPDRFAGPADAVAWLDAERPALVAAVTVAAASGRARTAVSLALRLAVFLHWRRHFDYMITTGQAAVDCAHHAGDRYREAGALYNLGIALREVWRLDEAITADLRPGDTLIIWKIDRLGRNLRDLIDIVTALDTRGVGVKSLTNGIIDTTTAHGKLVFGMFALMAEYEAALIRERTQAGLQAARARGRKGGRKPKMTPELIGKAQRMYDSRQFTMAEIASSCAVTPMTVYRNIRTGQQPAQA